jgi:hypothetical protein
MMRVCVGAFVSVLLTSASFAQGAAPSYLKAFPEKAFHKLTSGGQTVGKVEFSWKAVGDRLEFQESSTMRLTLFKKNQEIATQLSVRTNTQLEIQSLEFKMKSDEARIEMKGERIMDRLRMTIVQAGSTQMKDIPLMEPALMSATIRPYILMKGLSKAPKTYSASLVEPSALTTIPLEMSVKPASAADTWTLKVGYLSQSLTSEISKTGGLIRESSDLAGMPLEARPITSDEYAKLLIQGTKKDLVEIARVGFPNIPNAKSLDRLKVRVSGVDLASFRLNRHRQTLLGDQLTIRIEKGKVQGLNAQSLAGQKDFERYLQGDSAVPVHAAPIQRKAREIIGDESNLWKRALLIQQYVFENVQKVPTVSVPNGLEVLKTMRGDCNEHAVLFTSLARAAGVPTRILVGLVYGDQFYGEPGFYYHAWVEVYTGKEWVALDPTWNQVPADATHIAFVEGGLDQQVQVTALMGKIRLSPL